MDEECIALFLQHDAWYVPTLAISHLTPGQTSNAWEKRWVEQRPLAPDLCQRAEAAVDEHRHWFQRALAAGVKMALGSDVRPLKEAALLESGLWVKDDAHPGRPFWQPPGMPRRCAVWGLTWHCGSGQARRSHCG